MKRGSKLAGLSQAYNEYSNSPTEAKRNGASYGAANNPLTLHNAVLSSVNDNTYLNKKFIAKKA